MDVLFTAQLTYVSVIILLCLVASAFYFLNPLKKIEHNISSVKYLSLFFLISATAFAAFGLSIYKISSISILLNNFLFILAFTCLKSSFQSRHQSYVHKFSFDRVTLTALILCCTINQLLFNYVENSHITRTAIVIFSITFIILSVLPVVVLVKEHPSFGERVAIVALKLAIVCMSTLLLVLIVSNNPFYYLSVLTVSLSITVLLLFGATLTLFLSEIADMYHKESSLDFLTNLLNRRQFYQSANKVIALAQRQKFEMTIIMIDIDDFKFINDTFGHGIGDNVIINISDIIKNATRDSDISARFGGEEFCVVLPYTDIVGATELAERIRKAVEQTVMTSHICDIRYTASFGISVLDEHLDLNKAITHADRALYYSKEHGKNLTSVFSSEMKLQNN